jgi:sn-glycerol 3-phosphate transport system substrate-binding protein
MMLAAALMVAGMAMGTANADSKPIKITWWHSMGGDLGKEVNKLADAFNDSQDKYKVKPVYKGTYEESMTDAIAAFRAHRQPDILQVYEVGTGQMLAAHDAVVPMYKLMQKHNVKFSTDNFIPAVSSYYSDDQGHLLSMPFNSSSPVLFYNKDEFKKAGIDGPPKTWQQLEKDAKKLVDSGVKCGYSTTWQSWINLENYAAWQNIPFATNHNGYTGLDTKLLFNKKPFVAHIKRLSEMAQNGLFKYGGRESKGTPLFVSGTCGMLTGSSGSLVPFVNQADFDVGVAMMPYNSDIVDHPQNSIIGGATLWVLSGNPDDHYKGIAEFLKFLSQPKQQAEWSQTTGYVPVTKAAYKLNKKQGYYKKYPGAKVALQELSLHKPTKNSKGIRLGSYVQIRDIINEELESVWAGKRRPKKLWTQPSNAATRSSSALRNPTRIDDRRPTRIDDRRSV